jgi:conjugal transfer pilus assembly protein TraU
LRALVVSAVAFLVASVACAAIAPTVCHGKLFNPITDTNWNDFFPLTIMGMQMGPNGNPPEMYVPPICVCPGAFGIPSPGIGVSYWQPTYIAEVERNAGCAPSLGGSMLFSGYSLENSEQAYTGSDGGTSESSQSTRMQIHWYKYPLFSFFSAFNDLGCRSSGGFALAYATEIDPTWQNDLWAGLYSPEAGLFANTAANAACIADAIAANVAYPIDALFWCAGSWGNVYPFSGNSNESQTPFQVDNLELAKFIARLAREGLAWQTIGPSTICGAHVNPIWIKSQYRVDEVYPVITRGSPLVVGALPFKQVPGLLTNTPVNTSMVDLIWQGRECCVRSY